MISLELILAMGSTLMRVLEEALFAFYNARVSKELPADRIIALPVLFQVGVMDHAVKRGRWVIVGHVPLDSSLLNPPPRFIQDAIRKDQFSIYEKGGRSALLRRKNALGSNVLLVGIPRISKTVCATIMPAVRISGWNH